MRNLPTLQNVRAALYALSFGYAVVACGQQNLGFEVHNGGNADGWRLGGQQAMIDSTVSSEGNASLRLASTGSQLPPGVATAIATQTISGDAVVGDRIRLAADIKTEAIEQGEASIWLRLEGPQGFLHFEDTRNSPVSGTSEWARREIDLAVPPETTRVMFGASITGNGTAWFDNLAMHAYPSSSLPPPSAEVEAYITDVLDIMQEHSIVTQSVSWPRFRESAMDAVRGLQAFADTHAIVAVLLRRLGDNHSGFIAPEMVTQLRSSGPSDPGLGPWVAPAAQLIDKKFGYVMIPGFIGSHDQRATRFADEIRAAIRDLDAAAVCGWIVDLRRNTGGNMWPMLDGLSPILDDGNLGSLRHNDGTRTYWWYRSGAFGAGAEIREIASLDYVLDMPRGPVAVLVGPPTASSGEAVALSFVGGTDTRLFGSRTRGQTTGNEPFPLADGAMLNLATSVMTDRFGREYPQGIDPDVVIDERAGAQPLEEQATVQAAIEWLGQFDSCSSIEP